MSNSKYNPTLYFKVDNGKLIGALKAHVDDLAVVGEPSFVNNIISQLGQKFKIGANEELHHFLLIKITRDQPSSHLFMNQSHHIDKLCNRFLDSNHTPVTTPTDSYFKNLRKQSPEDAPSLGPYNQLIGSLL